MKEESTAAEILTRAPDRDAFRAHVRAGFRAPQKWLSPMYLYDQRGSELFEAICELPEYYPTRTETAILQAHSSEIAEAVGPQALVMEPGSGSGSKTRMLLEMLDDPVAFVPVEISRDYLEESVPKLQTAFPQLEILGVHGDFRESFDIPASRRPARRRLIFFPGSTIGNFMEDEAVHLLDQLRRQAGPNGAMLIGVDLRKDPGILERAYDDARGVTAAFNLNLLERMNRELGTDFDPSRFRHQALWNEADSRIEMHLVSQCPQTVHLDELTIPFQTGESILSECSHKFSEAGFARMAERAGWRVARTWSDAQAWFSLQYLVSP